MSLLLKGHANLLNIEKLFCVHVCLCGQLLSRVLLFAVLWIAACKAGIFQAKILDGLPCPLLGDLPNPGLEPVSAALQADLYH